MRRCPGTVGAYESVELQGDPGFIRQWCNPDWGRGGLWPPLTANRLWVEKGPEPLAVDALRVGGNQLEAPLHRDRRVLPQTGC